MRFWARVFMRHSVMSVRIYNLLGFLGFSALRVLPSIEMSNNDAGVLIAWYILRSKRVTLRSV